MKIHSGYPGGNVTVLRIEDSVVYLQNELRDSTSDWFFWSFCVEGAEGRTLTFVFDKKWVGYYGAAVSTDYENWRWSDTRTSPFSFTYTFSGDESLVYFAHDMVYYTKNFNTFLSQTGIKPEVLCISRGGREVPMIRLGDGERKIFLTSRHHACESTGTYVLMGFIKEYLKSPIENTELIVVPMVDYDGVVCGDQGKNRAPYDHNRDYTDSPIYPETAAIMSLAKQENAFFAIDFHSPWHLGGQNDYVFVVRKYDEKKPLFDRFGALLEKYCAQGGMKYFVRDDMMPNTSWNHDETPTAATFFSSLPSCHLAFSLETTYFGTEDNKVDADKLDAEGRAVCRALDEYLSTL